MALDIRSYHNTDTNALCRVFNAHYQAVGVSCVLTPLSFELCVLAKTYFSPEHLLVAEQDGRVIGFTLIGSEPTADLRALNTFRCVVSGLHVEPHEAEDEVAAQLLAGAARLAVQTGASSMRFCPPPPAAPYFAGLAPGDAMIGSPTQDIRQHQWLLAAGWSVAQAIICWDLDLAQFHSPMDRMQIQIRRMAHVDRLLDEPLLPWYVASMLGHTEQIGFQLTARDTRRIVADIVLWTIGQELLAYPTVIARLWPLELHECLRSPDQIIFLLAEAFRQLREDRFDRVRTVSDVSQPDTARLLQRVGFTAHAQGDVFSIEL